MSRELRSKRVPMLRVLGWLCTLLACGLVADGAQAQYDHLIFSKVMVKARPNTGYGSEYVAIENPTGMTVDLSRYHLTDATLSSAGYWEIVLGDGSGGGGSQGDFNARFPDGTSLGPGESLVVALEGSAQFQTQFGMLPDFELYEDAATPDGVPELVETHPGSIGIGLGNTGSNAAPSNGWLDNDDESLVLYYWDGESDLVQDVDYLTWGAESVRVDKSGVSIDGPDADTDASTYLDDTAVASQSSMLVSSFLESNIRQGTEESSETTTGGNGIGGHDETSEMLEWTWAVTTILVPPVGGGEFYASPVITAAAPTGTAAANTDVVVEITLAAPSENGADEMSLTYRVDGGTWASVGAYDQGGGTWQATIPGQAENAVVDWWVSVAGEEEGGDVWPSAAPQFYESYTVQAAVEPGEAHLIFSEVCVQGNADEFVEIYNPLDEAVDLTNYYLTDAVYNDAGYWRLPAGTLTQAAIGGGAYDDFHARFPAGTTIGAGEVLVVAMHGSDGFSDSWGVEPDLELSEDGTSADDIPDMLEVFSGSNGPGEPYYNDPGLSNSSEIVVLYYWDGVSDLVKDVDMFMWGTTTSNFVDRTGYSIGSSTYADDTSVTSQDAFTGTHDSGGGSFQRVDLDETNEPDNSGNGMTGHDETGEPLNTTWQVGDGTPGVYGEIELMVTGASLSPSRPQPDEAATVTVSVTGSATVSGVTLNWAADGGAYTQVTCVDGGAGDWTGGIPAQSEGVVITWYVEVAGSAGESAVWPDGAPTETESYTVETVVVGEGLARLLLTEVCTLGSTAEFVEVHNPNDFDVPLQYYYLTDAVYYESQAYWNLPNGTPTQASVGGGAYYDFTAKFPDDAVLEAGATITISIPGSDSFAETFPEVVPHYELFEDGDYADGVTDMVEVFDGSINGDSVPGLTNLDDSGTYVNGEMVALFYWDGASDLVTDIDIFIWGEGNSYSASKGGISIGSSTYASEDGYSDPFMTGHVHGESYQRVDYDEGTEAQSGGNGYEGADETSENFSTTWTVATADPDGFVIPEGSAEVTLTVPAATFLPSLESFQIEFTTEPGTEVALRIFDLEGRLVRHLFDSRKDGAASTSADYPSIASWEGRNEAYELVTPGMYIVHLQATDEETGDRTVKTAPAVVATRLGN